MKPSQRKLFFAKDKEDNVVIIDRLKPGIINNKFSCPHCNEEVIPKMGDTNIWHFAHKGKVCDALIDNKPDETPSKNLFEFTDKYTDKIDIKLGNSKNFLCKVCKRTFSKESGIRWDDNDYICKECYLSMDKSDFNF
jgi:hypothetical protein